MRKDSRFCANRDCFKPVDPHEIVIDVGSKTRIYCGPECREENEKRIQREISTLNFPRFHQGREVG
jgi:hypothetical protein